MAYNFLKEARSIKCSTLCRYDSFDVYSFMFDINGDVNGWDIYDNIGLYGSWKGILFGTAMDRECFIGRSSNFSFFDASTYYVVQIMLKITNENESKLATSLTKGKLQWITTEDAVWDNSKQEYFDLIEDDKFKIYEINLGTNQRWQGNITNLRIYPFIDAWPNDSFFIKYIKVSSPTKRTCSKILCPYYPNYEFPCLGAGKRASCEAFIDKKVYSFTEGVNDELIINIDNYGNEAFNLGTHDSVNGINIAKVIANKLSNVAIGGYAYSVVEHTDNNKIKIISGCLGQRSSVKILDSLAARELGFYNEYGKPTFVEEMGTEPASGFESMSSRLLTSLEINRLIDGNYNSQSYLHKTDRYSVEGGRNDFNTIKLDKSLGDLFVSDENHLSVSNLGQTIIDVSHPFNSNGFIKTIKIGGIVRRDNKAKVKICRPYKNGNFEVIHTLDIPAKTSTQYTRDPISYKIDCNIYINKGDIIGVYNVDLYVGATNDTLPDAAFYSIDSEVNGVFDPGKLNAYGSAGFQIFAFGNRIQDTFILDIDLGARVNIERFNLYGKEEVSRLEFNIARCLDINWEVDLYNSSHIHVKTSSSAEQTHKNIVYGISALSDGIFTPDNGKVGDSWGRNENGLWTAGEHSYCYINGDDEFYNYDPEADFFEGITNSMVESSSLIPKASNFKTDPIAYKLIFPRDMKIKIHKSIMYFKENTNFRIFELSYFLGDKGNNGNADNDYRFQRIPQYNYVTIDGTKEEFSSEKAEFYIFKNPTTDKIDFKSDGIGATNTTTLVSSFFTDWRTIEHSFDSVECYGFRIYCNKHYSTKLTELELYSDIYIEPSLIDNVFIMSSKDNELWKTSTFYDDSDNKITCFIGDAPRYIILELNSSVDFYLSEIEANVGDQVKIISCDNNILLENSKNKTVNKSMPVVIENVYNKALNLMVDIPKETTNVDSIIFWNKLRSYDTLNDSEIGPGCSIYNKADDFVIKNSEKQIALNVPVYGLKNLIDGKKAYHLSNEGAWAEFGTLAHNTAIDYGKSKEHIKNILSFDLIQSKYYKLDLYSTSNDPIEIEAITTKYKESTEEIRNIYYQADKLNNNKIKIDLDNDNIIRPILIYDAFDDGCYINKWDTGQTTNNVNDPNRISNSIIEENKEIKLNYLEPNSGIYIEKEFGAPINSFSIDFEQLVHDNAKVYRSAVEISFLDKYNNTIMYIIPYATYQTYLQRQHVNFTGESSHAFFTSIGTSDHPSNIIIDSYVGPISNYKLLVEKFHTYYYTSDEDNGFRFYNVSNEGELYQQNTKFKIEKISDYLFLKEGDSSFSRHHKDEYGNIHYYDGYYYHSSYGWPNTPIYKIRITWKNNSGLTIFGNIDDYNNSELEDYNKKYEPIGLKSIGLRAIPALSNSESVCVELQNNSFIDEIDIFSKEFNTVALSTSNDNINYNIYTKSFDDYTADLNSVSDLVKNDSRYLYPSNLYDTTTNTQYALSDMLDNDLTSYSSVGKLIDIYTDPKIEYPITVYYSFSEGYERRIEKIHITFVDSAHYCDEVYIIGSNTTSGIYEDKQWDTLHHATGLQAVAGYSDDPIINEILFDNSTYYRFYGLKFPDNIVEASSPIYIREIEMMENLNWYGSSNMNIITDSYIDYFAIDLEKRHSIDLIRNYGIIDNFIWADTDNDGFDDDLVSDLLDVSTSSGNISFSNSDTSDINEVIWENTANARWVRISLHVGGVNYQGNYIRKLAIYPDVETPKRIDGGYNCEWDYLGTDLTKTNFLINLAYGAKVSSNTQFLNYSPTNVVNGDSTGEYGIWGFTVVSGEYPYIEIDFGDTYLIDKYTVYNGRYPNDGSYINTGNGYEEVYLTSDSSGVLTCYSILNEGDVCSYSFDKIKLDADSYYDFIWEEWCAPENYSSNPTETITHDLLYKLEREDGYIITINRIEEIDRDNREKWHAVASFKKYIDNDEGGVYSLKFTSLQDEDNPAIEWGVRNLRVRKDIGLSTGYMDKDENGVSIYTLTSPYYIMVSTTVSSKNFVKVPYKTESEVAKISISTASILDKAYKPFYTGDVFDRTYYIDPVYARRVRVIFTQWESMNNYHYDPTTKEYSRFDGSFVREIEIYNSIQGEYSINSEKYPIVCLDLKDNFIINSFSTEYVYLGVSLPVSYKFSSDIHNDPTKISFYDEDNFILFESFESSGELLYDELDPVSTTEYVFITDRYINEGTYEVSYDSFYNSKVNKISLSFQGNNTVDAFANALSDDEEWTRQIINITISNSGYYTIKGIQYDFFDEKWGAKNVSVTRISNTEKKWLLVVSDYAQNRNPGIIYKNAEAVFLEKFIVNSEDKKIITEYPWWWVSIRSDLEMDHQNIKSDYRSSIQVNYSGEYLGDMLLFSTFTNFGQDIDWSIKDFFCFWWYIDDINNLDISFGDITFGTFPDLSGYTLYELTYGYDLDGNKIIFDTKQIYYRWRIKDLALHSGWNHVRLKFEDYFSVYPKEYKTFRTYTSIDDTLELCSNGVDLTDIRIRYRGKGKPLIMNIDDIRIIRNVFDDDVKFGKGLCLTAFETLELPISNLDLMKGSIEFWLKSYCDISGRDIFANTNSRALFTLFNNSNEFLSFGIKSGVGFHVVFGEAPNKILYTSEYVTEDLDFYINSGDVVHIGVVWNNTGTFMDNNNTIRVYINNKLALSTTETWEVSDLQGVTMRFGGNATDLTYNNDCFGSGIFSNVKIYNYCKTNFDLTNEGISRKEHSYTPNDFVEISKDDISFYGVNSTELPFIFKNVPADEKKTIYVRSNKLDGFKDCNNKTGSVLIDWESIV